MPPIVRDIPPGLPGQVLEAFAEGFLCGQVGSITVQIADGDNVVFGPTTAGIVELDCTGAPDNSAVYRFLGTYPSDPTLSPYVIIWTGENLAGTVTTGSEEFEVTPDAPSPPSAAGPCGTWVDGVDVADCCDVEYGSDTADALDLAASQASELLYMLQGKDFPGLCGPITVRPCQDYCSCWGPFQLIDYAGGGSWPLWTGWGWGTFGGGWWFGNGTECGCGCLSKVKLAGGVQAIAQVKIDGETVAPSTYRLDKQRYLVRTDDGFWPSCQDLSRDDSQPSTWSVSYWYGATPPDIGVAAAKQLACELYKACAGQDCALPEGATRVNRQGITIERQFFRIDPATKAWRTGLTLVDAFLNAYNPSGQIRKPVFWAPSRSRRYAPELGS